MGLLGKNPTHKNGHRPRKGFPSLGFRQDLVYLALFFEPDLIFRVPEPRNARKIRKTEIGHETFSGFNDPFRYGLHVRTPHPTPSLGNDNLLLRGAVTEDQSPIERTPLEAQHLNLGDPLHACPP